MIWYRKRNRTRQTCQLLRTLSQLVSWSCQMMSSVESWSTVAPTLLSSSPAVRSLHVAATRNSVRYRQKPHDKTPYDKTPSDKTPLRQNPDTTKHPLRHKPPPLRVLSQGGFVGGGFVFCQGGFVVGGLCRTLNSVDRLQVLQRGPGTQNFGWVGHSAFGHTTDQ